MSPLALFDRPLGDWTYDDVHAFLELRLPENENIEYKQDHTTNLKDTLVAMANGDGGYIFVGVSEIQQTRAPREWPLLAAGRDHTSSPYNQAAAETSPPVPIEARQFTLDDASSAHQGKSIVVVRVRPGIMPPYFAKASGVRIRVGEGDHHADPRVLQQLFARRDGGERVRSEHRALFEQAIAGAEPPNPTILQFYLAPLITPVRLPRRESTAKAIRDIAWNYVFRERTDLHPRRNPDGVVFGEVGEFDLRVTHEGPLYFREAFPTHAGASPNGPLNFRDLAKRTLDFLEMGAEILANVGGYTGELYVAASLVNLGERPIEMLGPGWNTTSPPRRRMPKRVDRWTFDEVDYRTGGDTVKAAKEMLGSMYWEADYQDYERFLDSWELRTRRQRGLT
jgi:hypothetical protein